MRLRPRMLPSQMVATAPKKQPRVYAPTANTGQSRPYRAFRCALTSDCLYRCGMTGGRPRRRIHCIDLGEVSEEGRKSEKTTHYTLIYFIVRTPSWPRLGEPTISEEGKICPCNHGNSNVKLKTAKAIEFLHPAGMLCNSNAHVNQGDSVVPFEDSVIQGKLWGRAAPALMKNHRKGSQANMQCSTMHALAFRTPGSQRHHRFDDQ